MNEDTRNIIRSITPSELVHVRHEPPRGSKFPITFFVTTHDQDLTVQVGV